MRNKKLNSFIWLGSENKHLDSPNVVKCGNILVGCYGGDTEAGQYKNEDGVFVMSRDDWEFSVILDAHNSADSVKLIINILDSVKKDIVNILEKEDSLIKINKFIQNQFINNRKILSLTKGETACLICVRKENYLYWFSIGDCLCYLLNEELSKKGQYALNQRQFYEWVGETNTFDLKFPCYSNGFRELRRGENVIILVTDGFARV